MAVLLDAYGALALLRGEPAAPEVVRMLEAGDPVRIHPLNLAEVLDRMGRLDGVDADDVEADIVLAGIVVEEPDSDALIDAGRLRARHYRRTGCAVSLADCVAAAHATRTGAPLATSDPHLAAVLTAEGGTLAPLPDTSGIRPTP